MLVMRKLNLLITQKLDKELAYSVCFSNIEMDLALKKGLISVPFLIRK